VVGCCDKVCVYRKVFHFHFDRNSSSKDLKCVRSLNLTLCFRNIYLGETFSSYICVHNDSNQIAKHVSVKVSEIDWFCEILSSHGDDSEAYLLVGSSQFLEGTCYHFL
jgi:hypothetical protein